MATRLRVRDNSDEIINEFTPIVSPYFGEQGVTSTRAAQLCDAAKHSYEAIESELESVNFIQIKFGLIGTSEENFTLAKDANSNCNFDDFKTKLDKITEAKAFIAFLREAIKAKTELADEVSLYMSKELQELKAPKYPDSLTEQDVIDQMSVKNRETYLSLETKCAVYGKFIHPGRRLDKAIKEINGAKAEPRSIDYAGNNTIIRVYNSVISVEEANEVYDKLQKEHRKAESELNGLKHLIEETIKADTAKKLEEFKKANAEYSEKYNALLAQDSEIREKRRKEIQALRIVIPNRFKTLYDELSKTK